MKAIFVCFSRQRRHVMKKATSISSRRVMLMVCVLILSSLACNLPDLQEMALDFVLRTLQNDAVQDFLPSDLLEQLDPQQAAELLEIFDEMQAGHTRVFTGTADYHTIFNQIECPQGNIAANELTITVTEEGAATGFLRYQYTTGNCQYTEDGQSYVQRVEFLVTGTFEGHLSDDQGTITLYEDWMCKTVYDSRGDTAPDPDCNIFPPREVDITITDQQMTGLIRMPGADVYDGMFNVTFSAVQN